MNERIKELAKQCWEDRFPGKLHFDQEKFAELIVRECVSITRGISVALDQPKVYDAMCNAVKEHFGVEE